jgi:hypothetical protein
MAPNPAGVYVASAGLRCCNIVLVTSSGGRAEAAGSSAVSPGLGRRRLVPSRRRS